MLPVALQERGIGARRDQPGHGHRRDRAQRGILGAKGVGNGLENDGPPARVGRGLIDLFDDDEQIVLVHRSPRPRGKMAELKLLRSTVIQTV